MASRWKKRNDNWGWTELHSDGRNASIETKNLALESAGRVPVVAIGRKVHDKLFIGGREVEL